MVGSEVMTTEEVYVVMRNASPEAVFSSREKAEELCAVLSRAEKRDGVRWSHYLFIVDAVTIAHEPRTEPVILCE